MLRLWLFATVGSLAAADVEVSDDVVGEFGVI